MQAVKEVGAKHTVHDSYAKMAGMEVNALVSVKPLMRISERTRFSIAVASANFCARKAPREAPHRCIYRRE